MNAFLLEDLYIRLGRPAWYWPVVGLVLLAVFIVGSSVCAPEGLE